MCSVTLQPSAPCWASVKDTSEEETCLHQARASDPPQKHHRAPGIGGSSLRPLQAAPGQGSLWKEIMTNHQHRHHQRWMGGKGCSSGALIMVHPQMAPLSKHLPRAWPCPKHSRRDLRGANLSARAHIGYDLPCPRPILPTMWEQDGSQADLFLAHGMSTTDHKLYWKQ